MVKVNRIKWIDVGKNNAEMNCSIFHWRNSTDAGAEFYSHKAVNKCITNYSIVDWVFKFWLVKMSKRSRSPFVPLPKPISIKTLFSWNFFIVKSFIQWKTNQSSYEFWWRSIVPKPLMIIMTSKSITQVFPNQTIFAFKLFSWSKNLQNLKILVDLTNFRSQLTGSSIFYFHLIDWFNNSFQPITV